VGLKRRVDQMQAGESLRVTAHDTGARADLPARCRITGYVQIFANHPDHVLRKKDD
jgi:TusA-related sulfurtransferase